MKTIKLNNLFLFGIPASLGAPIFLGIGAVMQTLYEFGRLPTISLGLYVFAVWVFSFMLTESVIASTVLFMRVSGRHEINLCTWSLFYVIAFFLFFILLTLYSDMSIGGLALTLLLVFVNIAIFVLTAMKFGKLSA